MPGIVTSATSLSLVLGVASLAFLLSAVCTGSWVGDEAGNTSGFWQKCDFSGEIIRYKHYEIVRGFSMCGCGMGILAVVLCSLSSFNKTKVKAGVVGTAFVVEGFFIISAVALFTIFRNDYEGVVQNIDLNWGYSFILGWTAFLCSIVAGAVMMDGLGNDEKGLKSRQKRKRRKTL